MAISLRLSGIYVGFYLVLAQNMSPHSPPLLPPVPAKVLIFLLPPVFDSGFRPPLYQRIRGASLYQIFVAFPFYSFFFSAREVPRFSFPKPSQRYVFPCCLLPNNALTPKKNPPRFSAPPQHFASLDFPHGKEELGFPSTNDTMQGATPRFGSIQSSLAAPLPSRNNFPPSPHNGANVPFTPSDTSSAV